MQNGFTAARHAAMTSWHRPVYSLLWASKPTIILGVSHHEWVA